MSDISHLVDDVKDSAVGAYDYVSHPADRYDDAKKFGKATIDYTKYAIQHPSRPVQDVRSITGSYLDDLVSNSTHKFLFYAGVLYFILSHKSFKALVDSFFKSIPVVKKLYLFPHLANTFIFLLFLYIVRYKIDNDIVKGISELSRIVSPH
tara:strand:- start:274 stop:726 length:453 start_codon:yes stop_codon:yes gene_type:complete